jgi:hypothetical protein
VLGAGDTSVRLGNAEISDELVDVSSEEPNDEASTLVAVAEAQQRAKRRLPKAVYDSLVAGTEKGLTVA